MALFTGGTGGAFGGRKNGLLLICGVGFGFSGSAFLSAFVFSSAGGFGSLLMSNSLLMVVLRRRGFWRERGC